MKLFTISLALFMTTLTVCASASDTDTDFAAMQKAAHLAQSLKDVADTTLEVHSQSAHPAPDFVDSSEIKGLCLVVNKEKRQCILYANFLYHPRSMWGVDISWEQCKKNLQKRQEVK